MEVPGLDETKLDDDVPPPTQDEPSTSDLLAHGQLLGRYILLESIGEGGMGVVYAAYDPELDRRVALKLLRRHVADDSSLGRARLLREAQAMAKLSHPNVIGVHDVGTLGDRVFIAMELVVGSDLRAWLAAAPHSRAQVLGVFAQAGRGLAAAHAAGLIHRDFKPGNVLVGDDGVVRVADFGLARRFGGPDADPSATSRDAVATPGEGVSVSVSVTHTGAVLGTPAYMAPEQHLGRDLDARADQFSFCVALWEALQGERPFRATHPVELMVQVTRGEIPPSPKDAAMPSWLRRVLTRGLATDPTARWPSMAELLAALERDPSRQRRRLVLGGGAALAVGALVLFAIDRPGPCAGAEHELAQVWNATRGEAIATSFAATALPFADDAAAGVNRRLDDYAAHWLKVRADACAAGVAIDAAPRESPGMRCVERRRRDLGALVDLLEQADAALVERANEALGALRSLEACADAGLGFGDIPIPADPSTRVAVDALRDDVGRVNALDIAGRWAEASTLSHRVIAAATELGDPALLAEAELAHAHALAGNGRGPDAVQHFLDAAVWAVQGGYDEILLDAWIALVWHTGVELGQYERSLEWGRLADAMLTRRGRPTREVGNLRAAQSAAAASAGRSEEALAAARDALEVRLREQPGEPIIANTMLQIGNTLVSLGRYDEALQTLEEAKGVAIEAEGRDHPVVGAIENSIGVAHHMRGESALAEPHWRRAYEIMVGALGPDHPDLFYSLGNIAESLREQGKYDEALATMRRVEELQRKSLPEGHREIGTSRHNIATLMLALGDAEGALPVFREALELREKALGPDDPSVANTLTGLGEALVALGRHAEAIAPLERALVIRDAKPRRELDRAHTRIMLGQARWKPDDGSAARALVEDAAASIADVQGGEADRLRKVAEQWLAAHE
jgi:tetratricopeptide (TPR) repeat protein